MTSPDPSVPRFAYKICKSGMHQYDRTLKTCPECAIATDRKHYLNNRDQQMARARAKILLDHEGWKKQQRERYQARREEHRAKRKQEYWDNREEKLRKVREYSQKHREYGVWSQMIKRCSNPSTKGYWNYGGRGIGVCERWLCENGYKNFLADMGKRPSDRHTLERLDNNKGYGPDNCAWATRSAQCRNRRSNYLISFNGQTRCLQEWSEITGIKYARIRDRIERLKWTPERALTQTIDGRKTRKHRLQAKLFPVEK